MELFQKATRQKLRFETPNGQISVEDLWDLPLSSSRPGRANLDDIAKDLYKQLKEKVEISFVNKTSPNDTLNLMFDTVKAVIEIKMAENAAAEKERTVKSQALRLREIIDRKKDTQLENSSLEELMAQLEALEKQQ